MLKNITIITVVFVLFAQMSYAQWTNEGQWPTTSPVLKGQNHSLAVDPEGKVWVGWWGPKVKHGVAPGDTLKKSVYLIYVFKPDGTQASFSPIWRLQSGTINDTLLTTNRGMRLNSDGNILFLTGSSPTPNYLYMVDYKTGQLKKRVQLKYTGAAPAVSSNGTIFIAPVVPAATAPLEMYDQNFTLLGNALNTTVGFSRSFEVSKDGNTIYWAGYTNFKVYVYNRADEFSNFALKDSIMDGVACESFTWRPGTNQLWMSGGSNNDKPKGKWTMGSWYAYDVVQKKVVDSLKWKFADAAKPDERPRALGFSPDGKIAYLGSFGTSTSDLVQKVVLGVGSGALVELDEGFEKNVAPALPAGWTAEKMITYKQAGYGKDSDGVLGWNEKDQVTHWVVSPKVIAPKALTYWLATYSNTDDFSVQVESSPNGTTWTKIAEYKAPTDIGYTFKKMVHTLNATQDLQFRWITTNPKKGGIYLDIIKAGNVPTDIKKLDEIPTQFELSQNYPNPFNPATTIKFSLPEQGQVSLKVYNTLGQEVMSLINEVKSAGTYEVKFNASDLSSGVYMYTLRTEKMSLTKKMLLVK